ncbi:L,D-transpeptidase [Nocardia aurantiaca]|uniref:L,D-transpeptidase family protein n=1 Tax=Nocardia aurantiaca TaxID=2675850 RepID=A0A6I3KPT6_9NOCA|nr:Ig-like domain-containing protein [Nocardia aurantiaca]MTE12653.1 L,D-transpeptidase family protein [Nocardia aurantiaca]
MGLRRRQVLAGIMGLGGLFVASSVPNRGNGLLPYGSRPARLVFPPVTAGRELSPRRPGRVDVLDGTLTSVAWIDETGRPLPGALSPDLRTWISSEPLGYGHTYTASAVANGETGEVNATAVFTTVRPDALTGVAFRSNNLLDLQDGETYGVGLVLVAHFDEAVDRAAAERALQVATEPAVPGAWYWLDDRNAHWRPENYHTPGTRITVAANLFGVRLGEGLYGRDDQRVSVVIGPSHVAIADDNTKHIQVFENGNLVRTMPTSMGRGGTAVVGGRLLSFWTHPGVYTVLDKKSVVSMDSSSYGLPVNSGLGYRESINNAVRISHDGIYLHELAATVWAQGNTNVSHGCLNLSPADAAWYFDFAEPGDIVEVRNTGGNPLDIWQGGDWTISWPDWQHGSALA